MRLELLDVIDQASPERLVARLGVPSNAGILADHFPDFPVLPGALLLEAFVQASGWLAHLRRGFARAMTPLREVRNLKLGRFVAPGDQLTLSVSWVADDATGLSFAATAEVADQRVASAQLALFYYDLAERRPELAELDARAKAHHRRCWARLSVGRRGTGPNPDATDLAYLPPA